MTTLEIILLSILVYFILSFFILTLIEKEATGESILKKFVELIICLPILLVYVLVWPVDELVGRARRKRLSKKFEEEKKEEENDGNKKTMEV